MALFNTPAVRVRVWCDRRMYAPEDAASAGFVCLPTGQVGQVVGEQEGGEALRLDMLDAGRARAMLSTRALDADRREVFVGDVVEELQHARRYVIQHGHAVVSEFATVGFFGEPLGKLERRMLRISDNLGYFRVIGTIYDADFESVRASTP